MMGGAIAAILEPTTPHPFQLEVRQTIVSGQASTGQYETSNYLENSTENMVVPR